MEPQLPLDLEVNTQPATPQPSSASSTSGSHSLQPPATSPSLLTSPASRMVQLKQACEQWRGIDLDGRRATIDTQALSMVDEEDRAVTARKALADQTKAFKRMELTDQLNQVGPVIKAYQEEINLLTKRAKAGEQAFLTLYKSLHDAPDPFVILNAALPDLDRLRATEDALKAAQATIADFEQEFSGLKNQEITVRKLERENHDLLASLEQRVQQAAEERTQEAREQVEELRRAFAESEKKNQAKTDLLREQLASALSEKASIQSAALSQDRSLIESTEMRLSADAALLERDLEQAHLELASRDKEIADLRAQLNQQPQDQTEIKKLEEEIQTLNANAHQMDLQLRLTQQKLDQAQAALSTREQERSAMEEQFQLTIQNLKTELADSPSQSEFNSMKAELKALQEMEFASSASTTSRLHSSATSSTNTNSSTSPPTTVTPEQLLAQKSRHLESELTRVKLDLQESEAKNSQLQKQTETLESSLKLQKDLNQKLEEDLLKANENMVRGLISQANPSGSNASNTPGHSASSSIDFSLTDANPRSLLTPAGAKIFAGLNAITDTAASGSQTVPASAATTTNDTATVPATTTAAATIASLQQQLSQSASMLSLILQQRDRYRSKVEIVETTVNLLTNQVDKLKLDNQVLKTDNLKLYEKIQFVKSMQSSGSNSGDIETGLGEVGQRVGHRTGTSAATTVSGPEQKYAAIYEARLNPFAAFKARARSNREQALSTSERITLAIGRAVFSKKMGRTILFGYALILHLLVATVLWRETVAPHCGTNNGGPGGAHAHEH